MRIRILILAVVTLASFGLKPAWSDTVTVDLEYRTDTLAWQLYAKVVDTAGGNNGLNGIAALRAMIDNINFGTNGDAVNIAVGIGAVDPIAQGTPFERAPVLQTAGGTIDIVYGQDTSVPASVVGGVGVATRALIVDGTFASAALPPAFGNDDLGLTTDGNFLNAAAPGPFGNALPFSSVTLNVLNVTPAGGLAGDYNGNSTVDAADYTVWRDNLGGNASAFAAGSRQGSNTGPINATDYAYWKSNFGSPGSGAFAAPVPEPSTIGLLILAVGTAVVARGKRPIRRDQFEQQQ